VLTAANEEQAKGYRIQLQWRRQRGKLPDTEFIVIADPDGRRIGSGGSTFYVLDQLLALFGKNVFRKRILLLHSGGDSRRLPAYSVVGKLFTPLPAPDYLALFDVMLDNYAQTPCLTDGQIVIASGDVLLNFDPAAMYFSATGLTGVAYPESAENGQFFGVYVVAKPERHAVPAVDVLQKPDIETLNAAGAVDFNHRVWIDTGILNMAPDAVNLFLQCDALKTSILSGRKNYNLYHEILYAVKAKYDLPDQEYLRTVPLFVNCLPYCGFYHVGRSEEMLNNFYTLTHASVQYHFNNSVRSNAAEFPELKHSWVYNTLVRTEQIQAQSPSLIEGCHLDDSMVLEGENILTGIPQNSGPIHLQLGFCLSVVPLHDNRWAALLYGLRDSFKGDDSTFLHRPLPEKLQTMGISAEHLWPQNCPRDLWNARFFPCCASPRQAIELALSLQKNGFTPAWLQAERLSMAEILHQADQEKLIDHRADIERCTRLESLDAQLLDPDFSLAQLMELARNQEDLRTIADQLKQGIQTTSSLNLKARLEFWLGQVERENQNEETGEYWQQQAFTTIRDAVNEGLAHLQNAPTRLRLREDEVVWVMLPARLDFAGGWTDTPPICFERGGAVLNASVILNGQFPIQVVGKIRAGERVIGINSIDLGKRETLTTIEQLDDFRDPTEWLSLPKAAFYAAGLVPEGYRGTLSALLADLGGGIDLTLFSALPAGSGLGTSSILGAGLITALARLTGKEMSREEIYARTSHLEQLMTTGGGWQDQIGGVAGGVKLITTSPGFNQTPTLAWTHLKQPGVDLRDRFLLYYTGYRRLAKNLLRQVVGRYLRREKEALTTLAELGNLAGEMKDDLDHRRIDEFGHKIHLAWTLNKRLDQGQTTAEIEGILSRVDDYLLGAKLLGAGGGGFIFMVAKDREASNRIQNELVENPANERARFFDFDIEAQGMKISVL